MMDRKALWFLILLCLAMTAAAFWRLSLLPDWTQLSFPGRNGPHIRHDLVLFVPPLLVLSTIPFAFAMKWLVTGPQEAVQTYHRRTRPILLGVAVLATAMQAFNVSRSLGYGNGLDAETIARTVVVFLGILLMVQGNDMPKLPWISLSLSAFQLDPWQQARSRRFAGRLTIALGLAVIVAAVLLPLRAITPAVLALVPFYFGVVFWHSFRLRREPSPLP